MVRVVFAGDPGSGRPVLDAVKAHPGLELAGTFPGDQARQLAGPDGARLLAELGADALANFNSTVLYPEATLGAVRLAALNFHPGPLPRYAGLHVHQWGLINAEAQFGPTIHLMTARVDAGPIVAQELFALTPAMTGLTLYMKTLSVGARLMADALQTLADAGRLDAREQDLSARCYYGAGAPFGGVLDPRWDAAAAERFVRALSYRPFAAPTGGPMLLWRGRPLEIAQVRAESLDTTGAAPGEILELGEQGLLLAMGQGALRITTFWLDAARPASQAARELGMTPGARLGTHT